MNTPARTAPQAEALVLAQYPHVTIGSSIATDIDPDSGAELAAVVHVELTGPGPASLRHRTFLIENGVIVGASG